MLTAHNFTLKWFMRSFLSLSSIFAVGMGLNFLVNVVLARTISVSSFGEYGIVISWASILAIPIMSGMPLFMTREISFCTRENQLSRYKGLLISAFVWVIFFSAILLVGYFIISHSSIASRYIRNIGTEYFYLAFVLVPLMSGSAVNSGAIRGLGYPVAAAIPVQIMQPIVIIIALMTVAVSGAVSLEHALYSNLAGSACALTISFIVLAKLQPRGFLATSATYDQRWVWLRSIISFGMLSGIVVISTQLSSLILGWYGRDQDVAYLRVAERGAQLISFPVMVVETMIAPQVAAIVSGRDVVALRRLSALSARFTFATALAIGSIFYFFGKDILLLTFGKQYAEPSYLPLQILSISQILYVSMGSPGTYLAMSGGEKQNILAHFIGLICFSVAGWILIGAYGSVGAAISAGVGLIVTKVILLFLAKQRFGVWLGLF